MSLYARAVRVLSEVKIQVQSFWTLLSASRRYIFQSAVSESKEYSLFSSILSLAGPSSVARRIGIAKSPGFVVYLKTSAVV